MDVFPFTEAGTAGGRDAAQGRALPAPCGQASTVDSPAETLMLVGPVTETGSPWRGIPR